VSQVRLATLADYPQMHRIRMAVRENILSRPDAITEADYVRAITELGCGWVAEEDSGAMAGFAIAYRNGHVWAMFVDPDKEGRGHARALHAAMVRWLREIGVTRARLSTDPGTRAEAFYRKQGWQPGALTSNGELSFELPLSGA